MKYWTICWPDEDGTDKIETLSDDEIIEQYWDYWYNQMCKKFGKEYVDANRSKQDCIDDWCVIHWAVESK